MADTVNHGGDITLAEKILECVVVTPEETALETPATFVALPLFDGEIGIAPGHSPMIGRLGYGGKILPAQVTALYQRRLDLGPLIDNAFFRLRRIWVFIPRNE